MDEVHQVSEDSQADESRGEQACVYTRVHVGTLYSVCQEGQPGHPRPIPAACLAPVVWWGWAARLCGSYNTLSPFFPQSKHQQGPIL